jgi:hypothetical protein
MACERSIPKHLTHPTPRRRGPGLSRHPDPAGRQVVECDGSAAKSFDTASRRLDPPEHSALRIGRRRFETARNFFSKHPTHPTHPTPGNPIRGVVAGDSLKASVEAVVLRHNQNASQLGLLHHVQAAALARFGVQIDGLCAVDRSDYVRACLPAPSGQRQANPE